MPPPKKDCDHWSFLEEIEAPMWSDLMIVADYTVQDAAEEWFDTTHSFHQCSSSELKSRFSRRSERSSATQFDLQQLFSPKLPSSVSRSRGKDYKGKSKGRPLKDIGNKSSSQVVAYHEEIKPRVSLAKPRESSIMRNGLVSENKNSSSPKPKLSRRSPLSGTFTGTSSTNKSTTDTQSCFTFESGQLHQQNAVNVSSVASSNSSQLLSIVKRGLRRSIVTRQASRILEIRNDMHPSQSKACGSSSRKSSVSSSSIPGRSPISATAEGREITPDSRAVAMVGQRESCKLKPSNICKMPQGLLRQGKLTSGRNDTAKPGGVIEAKAKVQPSLSRKALLPVGGKVREVQIGSRKDKKTAKFSSSKQLMDNGKENIRSTINLTEKCIHRSSGSGSVNYGQKEKKLVLGRRVLADSKDKLKDQIRGNTTRVANRGVCVH